MPDDIITKFLNKVEDYQETISAIISFSHFLLWEDDTNRYRPNSYSFIGRKMNTTSSNKKLPNGIVTPDLIVQINNKYGIVGEAKKSFPINQDYWIRDLEQLEKYDDNLKGWKTDSETIQTSDIVLMTHFMRVVAVSDYIRAKTSSGELNFNRNFTVIGFLKGGENKTFLYFEKGLGNLTNQEFNERLRTRTAIPLEKIEPLNKIKFYDAEPPLPLTMQILWEFLFTQIPNKEKFMDSKGKKIILIRVNIHNLTQFVRQQFGFPQSNDNRQSEIPKISWIKNAMDMFVELKLAEKVKGSNNDYIIKFKRLKEPLKYFANNIIKAKQATIDEFL